MSTILTSLGRLGFTLRHPPSQRRQDLKQELALLEKTFVSFGRDHKSRKFLFHPGVGFRVDPLDPDTLMLKQKYTELHKILTRSYRKGIFLEKTLELIILADRCEYIGSN